VERIETPPGSERDGVLGPEAAFEEGCDTIVVADLCRETQPLKVTVS